MQVIRCIWSVL